MRYLPCATKSCYSQYSLRFRNPSARRLNSVRKAEAMELSEDDVLHILKLIDESKFDYFQLEVGELKITVSKGDPIPVNTTPQPVSAPPAHSAASPAARPLPVAPAA